MYVNGARAEAQVPGNLLGGASFAYHFKHHKLTLRQAADVADQQRSTQPAVSFQHPVEQVGIDLRRHPAIAAKNGVNGLKHAFLRPVFHEIALHAQRQALLGVKHFIVHRQNKHRPGALRRNNSTHSVQASGVFKGQVTHHQIRLKLLDCHQPVCHGAPGVNNAAHWRCINQCLQTEAQYVMVINDQNSFHGNGHLRRNICISNYALNVDFDAHLRFCKHQSQ